MTSSFRLGRQSLSARQAKNRRRPTGISRRKKKQLGFETLEDRRVMSADSPAIVVEADSIYDNLVSYSSNTPEGAAQLLLNELARYEDYAHATNRELVPNSIPTDPLVGNQWHLINTGQQVGQPDFQSIFGVPNEDINVAPAWALGYTGAGVQVAVIDSGVEITHPDLVNNIDPALQFDGIDFDFDATPTIGPNPFQTNGAHGTAVSGIIAAEADNGLGGAGVAPGAQIVPIRLIDFGQTEQGFIDSFRFETDQVDITNNSWGPAVTRGLAGPTLLENLALRDSVFFGRPDANGDPLGVIHVFSAGNDGLLIDTASYNGWVNSRYTIGVTGVDHTGEYNNVDGTTTGYPETSASTLVAAPTGSNPLDITNDFGLGSGIVTADFVGDFGFNTSDNTLAPPNGDRDFLEDVDYTSRFNGTSAAAPMVSGVIALMLEANPNLHWRDVQEILVRSARQNSEFTTQADGLDKSVGVEYQSTWIQNQVPLFHDPDPYDPLIPNGLQILSPTLDPNITGQFEPFSDTHYAPTPHTLTNAAGYTVSQGRGTNRENTGFAHGVVDAELAVRMAEQWHTRNQNLPDELTFTTEFNGAVSLPAAEIVLNVAADTGGNIDLVVPGGLDGDPGFSSYWDEYNAAVPNFNQNFPERGAPIELTVPSPNDMTIETIEVSIQVEDVPFGDFLDHVRIVLVSPNGTHSELNHYFVDPSFNALEVVHQAGPVANPLLNINGLDGVTVDDAVDFFNPGSIDTGVRTFTFSTNRSWGERSDDAVIFDPITDEPFISTSPGLTLPGGIAPIVGGGNSFNLIPPSAESLLTSGWQLYMENYSNFSFTIQNFEVAWHGSPINPNTERVQGLIGIDDNQDDLFNYERATPLILQLDADPALRLGEVQNVIDPTHESMAANVTVFAHRDVNSNGILDETDILVDQFVTGHDGNYYFDLVPDDYIISLDPESLGGLTPLEDSLTNSALFLQDYQTEWAITADFFNVWDYQQVGLSPLGAPLNEVPVNADGVPDPFLAPNLLDGTPSPVTYGMKNINFLLDPGAPAAPQVDFTGTIFADTNGDGLFNDDDVAVAGVGVFGDVNRNGALDAGEVLTTTDANGNYALTIPFAEDVTSVLNVGVRPPASWTASNPSSGTQAFLVEQGFSQDNVDFYITPPSGITPGDGSALSGIVLGTVFNDVNEDGFRQTSEIGVNNVTVYLDANNSGTIDAGDTVTTTNSRGSYAFANLPSGNPVIRVDFAPDSGISQTFPDFNLPQIAAINLGGTHTGVDFGVSSGSGGGASGGILDFGDLPDSYGTTSASNGARHPQGIYFLGTLIDSEPDGVPTADALGDDGAFIDDEDGITLDGGFLEAGTTGTIEAVASRHGAFLQGWIDFNDNGSFEASEQIFVNQLLDAGSNTLNFAIPATLGDSQLYARFRFGEFGLGSTGAAIIGEVEDYLFSTAVEEVAPLLANPDFDGNGMINGLDFLNWQSNTGMNGGATAANGDANHDGSVDFIDLAHWEIDYGANSGTTIAASSASTAAATAPPANSDFDQNGSVDGFDLLAWQINAGTDAGASIAHGDGNLDGRVDSEDLAQWTQNYGQTIDLPGGSGSSGGAVLTLSTNGSEVPSFGSASAAALSASGPAPIQLEEAPAPSSSPATTFDSLRFDTLFADLYRVDRTYRLETVVSRFETFVEDTLADVGEALPELLEEGGLVDRVFGQVERRFEDLLDPADEPDHATVLELALEEGIDWRI